jgi:Tfp pilus assembly protein PilF
MKCLAAASIGVLMIGGLVAVPLRTVQERGAGDGLSTAEAAFREGRFADAARRFLGVLATDQQNGAAHAGLVRTLLRQDHVADAAGAAERAYSLVPRYAPLVAAYGDVAFRQSDFARARRLYDEAVAANRGCARAYWGLGRVSLLDRGNRTAKACFIKAHEILPEDPDILVSWAATLFEKRDYVAALEQYLSLAVNEEAEVLTSVRARLAFLRAMSSGGKTFVGADTRRAYRLPLLEARDAKGNVLKAFRLYAVVNGRKLRLTLDTGAPGIYLNRKAAERSHLVHLSDGGPARGIGDEGARTTYFALADTVQIGDLKFSNCEILVDSGLMDDDSDGLIGANIFDQFLVRISFPNSTLELTPLAEGEKSVADDFWAIERQLRPGFTPVHVLGHLLLIDTTVDKVPGFLFAVDSGASTHLMSLAAARKVTSTQVSDRGVRGISGKAIETFVTRPVTLIFSGIAQPADVLTVDLSGPNRRQGIEMDGLIGLDALKFLDLTIDYTNGLVRFEYKGR